MFSDLREDELKFQNNLRMSIKSFDELLSKMDLERLHCVRVPISPAERLCNIKVKHLFFIRTI